MSEHEETENRREITATLLTFTTALALIAVVLAFSAFVMVLRDGGGVSIASGDTAAAAAQADAELPEGVYTAAMVAEHADPASDCWVIVDDLVFDLTEMSKLHPAQFQNCGGDSSEVYHRQHGSEVRDKMMRWHIGELTTVAGGTTVVAAPDAAATEPTDGECVERVGDPIDPRTELFVPVGSWDVDELMLVVEKDCRSIVFIDGSTHEIIARVHDLGHQPHTAVYSPDGTTMWMVSRDGWLSKIDLTTFEHLAAVDVGVSSRGTGLTDDGKYLLVGNFEPHTAVLLDADTLETLREYELTGTVDGEEITSKAGGVVELGSRLWVVLKDVNAVWEIDTAEPGFPVVNEYTGLGDGQTPLHDAYITPDGRFLIAAVQGADVAWVLDTTTREVVAEVPTGTTPHTGPGATVGNLTFVPTLDEDGVLSVIDTDTWTNVKNIDTGGPGLFVRHNPAAHDVAEYPYVWAETALGDRADEIYVIDVRSLEIVETLIPVAGESSWHPEFTFDGDHVYVPSQSGNQLVVYDAHTFDEVTRIEARGPSSVFNVGLRIIELGL